MHYEDFEKQFFNLVIDKYLFNQLSSAIAKESYLESLRITAQTAWQAFGRVLNKTNSKVVKND